MTDLREKRVLVVGLARTGRAAAQFLRRRGAVVTVTDLKPPAAFGDVLPELMEQRIGVELGVQREETFLRQDLIVVSPGVPWDLPHLQAARRRNIPVVPEIEMASRFLTGRLIGITGTNGKTTTTALLGRLLESSGFHTFVGGNIGTPLISAVDENQSDLIVVAELSSFQLEAIRDFRPHVAVFLNLTPNHLDRHPSFDAYMRAKAQIFRNQTPEDYAVLNADDSQVMSLASAITDRGIRKVYFSCRQDLPAGVFVADRCVRYRIGLLERKLYETREVALRGDFNLENVLAATAVACALGADFEAIRRAVREFRGVEHRLEFVRELRGVTFFNDSKATSVDATSKALSVFDRGVHLILGGKDKGAPYAPLRDLFKGRVRRVYLIGAAADRIAEGLAGEVELFYAGDLETAVHEAFRRAERGDTVLLSPACASFDQFEDFEHRGRVFKELVEQLAQNSDAERATPGVAGVPEEVSGEPNRAKNELPGPAATDQAAGPTSGPEVQTEESVPGASSAGSVEPRTESIEPPEPSPHSELIYVYEVGVDESPPGVDLTEAQGEVDPEKQLLSPEDLASPENVQDDPLPFEVRKGAAGTAGELNSLNVPAAASKGTNSASVLKTGEEGSGLGSPLEGSRGQGRLPGMD